MIWVAAGMSAAIIFSAVTWKVFLIHWWRPVVIKKTLEEQGIPGLKYRFLYGNIPDYAEMLKKAQSGPMDLSHDILPRVLPHYDVWSKLYGKRFFYWYGSIPRLIIPDPQLIKEILSNKFGHYEKSPRRPDFNDFLGKGLVAVQGETWAIHRRIVSPAFHMEKMKAMIPRILETTNMMFNNWERLVRETEGGRAEIEVSEEFRALAADIIAQTAFGTSYNEGKQVCDLQRKQQILIAEADRTVYIPGSRFVPTLKNRHRWKLNQQIQESLRKIIRSRLESTAVGNSGFYVRDLLGLMLAANKKELEGSQKNLSLSIQDIIDECRTFFFAGHETTATLLTWTTLLLARHEEWQKRARAEVLSVCGAKRPDPDALNHLKIVTMVLNESLRLYPPSPLIIRSTYKKIKLDNMLLPKGTNLVLPILALHHSREIWGEDVNEFNPGRFAEGVAKASKIPFAFMPFSIGPRFCVGQNFAMLEAKLILSMMLQRFSFSLSPAYRHAPTTVIILQPQYGIQIMVEGIFSGGLTAEDDNTP